MLGAVAAAIGAVVRVFGGGDFAGGDFCGAVCAWRAAGAVGWAVRTGAFERFADNAVSVEVEGVVDDAVQIFCVVRDCVALLVVCLVIVANDVAHRLDAAKRGGIVNGDAERSVLVLCDRGVRGHCVTSSGLGVRRLPYV